MTTGERIRTARENAKLSQEALGALCGTTKQTIFKYESGKISNIPIDKVEAIGKATNTDPAWIMGWGRTNEKSKEDNEMLQAIHDKPGLRMMFDASAYATNEDIEQAVAIIKAFYKTKEGGED